MGRDAPVARAFALLSVIARRHENLVVGPLVARIGSWARTI